MPAPCPLHASASMCMGSGGSWLGEMGQGAPKGGIPHPGGSMGMGHGMPIGGHMPGIIAPGIGPGMGHAGTAGGAAGAGKMGGVMPGATAIGFMGMPHAMPGAREPWGDGHHMPGAWGGVTSGITGALQAAGAGSAFTAAGGGAAGALLPLEPCARGVLPCTAADCLAACLLLLLRCSSGAASAGCAGGGSTAMSLGDAELAELRSTSAGDPGAAAPAGCSSTSHVTMPASTHSLLHTDSSWEERRVTSVGSRIMRRTVCCQIFFSFRGHRGFSRNSAAPSLMPSMTSSGLGLSDIRMKGRLSLTSFINLALSLPR
mmetsp:Transcript_33808/g.85602  ORF Transcript_33808/g.85602 Transcript_33808/m.85602 type:complete len:316 (-) Transcript_33808:386-1333(-)